MPNRFPVVSMAAAPSRRAGRLFRSRAAAGLHEVVIETPVHNRELPDRDLGEVHLLLDALQRRLESAERRPSTRYVTIFKNKGVDAGTSLEHPHSQIVALDFMPPEVNRRVQRSRRYFAAGGSCLLCAVVEDERRLGQRVVFETDGFLTLAPYASQAAGETMLIPLGHAPSFSTASPEDLERLGSSLIQVLQRTRQVFADPAYNVVLQTAPVPWRGDEALHWYWQLSPRLTRPAGFELGTRLYVNTLPPEEVASLLRAGDARPR